MDIYQIKPMEEALRAGYVGRGIVVGTSPDGAWGVTAYFIMGRSENSRNRVFRDCGDRVMIYPYDPAKVEDPSLIIYAPVREAGDRLVVTNGDQTDTVCDGLAAGKSFSEALQTRCFEPDAPNLTPRISALLSFDRKGGFSYEMSILKSVDAAGSGCARYTFSYPATPGLGHFLHTYVCDGNPLPTFQGEPERVAIDAGAQQFADRIWEHLHPEHRISLYVRYTHLCTGEVQSVLYNRYQ